MGRTPLHFAALEGHKKVVWTLVAHGANVSCSSNAGITPSYLAKLRGHDDIVKFLDSKNTDINRLDQDGKTALYKATDVWYIKVMEFLIENKADVNQPNLDGKTPLHAAATKKEFCDSSDLQKRIDLLLENGAHINVQDKKGNTPLHDAVEDYEIYDFRNITTEALLKRGAKVTICNAEGKIAFDLTKYTDISERYEAVQALWEGTISTDGNTISYIDLRGASKEVSIDWICERVVGFDSEALEEFAEYSIGEVEEKWQHLIENIKNSVAMLESQNLAIMDLLMMAAERLNCQFSNVMEMSESEDTQAEVLLPTPDNQNILVDSDVEFGGWWRDSIGALNSSEEVFFAHAE